MQNKTKNDKKSLQEKVSQFVDANPTLSTHQLITKAAAEKKPPIKKSVS